MSARERILAGCAGAGRRARALPDVAAWYAATANEDLRAHGALQDADRAAHAECTTRTSRLGRALFDLAQEGLRSLLVATHAGSHGVQSRPQESSGSSPTTGLRTHGAPSSSTASTPR